MSDNAEAALRAKRSPGGRLVVVGGRWIGCEVAATARGIGVDVAVIEQAHAPLERVLGPELGRFFLDLHNVGVHDPAATW